MRQPHLHRFTSNERGYSLIEGLIAVLLLGLVVLIGIPNLQRAKVSATSNSGLRQISTMFELARSEAVKRHSPVGVWFRSGAPQLVVYEDWIPSQPTAVTNGNATYDHPVEEVLRSFQFDQSMALGHPTGASVLQLGAGDSVVFRADGSPRFGTGAPSAPAVYLKDRWDNHFRVRVNQWTGRISVEQYLGGSSWTGETSRWTWKH